MLGMRRKRQLLYDLFINSLLGGTEVTPEMLMRASETLARQTKEPAEDIRELFKTLVHDVRKARKQFRKTHE